MALSRRVKGDSLIGGARRRLTSFSERALGRVRPLFGKSINAKGFCLTIFCCVRKAKNDFREETRRALLRLEIDFWLQRSRKAWIKETSTLLRCFFPLAFINVRKKAMSAEYASTLFSASRLSEMRWCKKRSRAALNCAESGDDIDISSTVTICVLYGILSKSPIVPGLLKFGRLT